MTLNNKSERYCRVCGLDQGEEGVRVKSGQATFNICDCCGVEFGYEDAIEAGYNISSYRLQWLYNNNARWFNIKIKPQNWSLCKQLKNIPKKYQDEWIKLL